MKKKSTAIGATILFALKSGKTYTGYLKSYVLDVSNWSDLTRKTREICKREQDLIYVGIEDLFYVSGPFKESNTLGKSNLFEINTIKAARELLLGRANYSYQFIKSKQPTAKWFKVNLVYYYRNTELNDISTKVCIIPVKAKSLNEIKIKTNQYVKTEKFLKKAFPDLNVPNYKYLKYIGIEDIFEIKANPKDNEAFEVFYKEKVTLKSLNKLIPNIGNLKDCLKNLIGSVR